MELRTIQFDPEEPSDLSKAICDRPEPDETGAWKWVGGLLIIFIIAGAIIALRPSQPLTEGTEHPDYAPDIQQDIYENDGVLYFPDGSPVRNYEQMDRYLESR
jgi:hypothetical protein